MTDLLSRAEDICGKLDNGELHWQEYKAIVPELIAEIKRLEDALVEERARRIYPYSMPRWETLQEDDHHVVTFGGIEDRYGKKSYRRIARAQLRAEGVIG